MKKNLHYLIILPLLFTFISALRAQQLSSINSESWSGSSWQTSGKNFFSYDGNGYMTNYISQLWNTGSSSYVNSAQGTFTNNGIGIPLIQTTSSWSGSIWVNNSRTTNTYNGSGHKTYTLGESWNSGTSTWENSYQINYTNNGIGNPTQETIQVWLSNTWTTSSRITYTYNGSDNISSQLTESWSGSAWQNSFRVTITYNGSNQLTHSLTQTWNTGSNTWTDNSQYNYTYGANGKIDVSVLQGWYSSWKNIQRNTYNYTATSLINRVKDDVIFRAYPNPVSDVIHIDFENNLSSPEITLMNPQGTIIQQEVSASSSFSYNISHLPDGVYYLNVKDGDKNQTKIIVKSK